MTTGYVFRVENQATVLFLQQVGVTGCLTTLEVSSTGGQSHERNPVAATLAYVSALGMTALALYAFVILEDPWALGVLATFIFIRACNVLVMKRRSRPGWFGAPEPGEKSDLLVLLSQDRWIRLQGPTDDVKAVTAGSWMKEPTAIESWITSTATLLTWLNASFAANAKHVSKMVFLALFLGSHVALRLTNQFSNTMHMHGRTVRIKKGSKVYARRRDLVDELVKETGEKHWAMKLGMLPAKASDVEPPIM